MPDDTQALTRILTDLATTQYTLSKLTEWLSLLVLVLAVSTVGGLVWVGLELRAIRRIVLQLAATARDILRHVS